ncbi:cellulase family glycosylhydrolase [Ruminococcus flavefaciens]|uniref:cellulase n=2 Tax=Ruminococcus TaxID=1263 RepID=A0A1M7M3M0_RUMFL|nr:cellulase family glycosylhydrolase [Ruminococcus sp.]SHM85256.1 Aryl-phospho-beta-D-glucosidase BglC, GH1 family [Ruminococcus flavefaciens]
MKKFTRSVAAVVSAAALAMTGAAPCLSQTTMTASAVDTNNDDWLHAEGSRLYDMNGNEVWLTGANWFGFNCGENVPHYLWSADADDCLTEIADRGINIIRFPISTELIVSWMNGTPNEVGSFSCNTDPAYCINADFCGPDGKTPVDSMQVFDIMMRKCKEHGIKAFIDIHSPDANNSGHNYNLWYGKAGVTTKVWIDSLVWLADKYKNDDTLIGYDLKNEPHGKGQEGDEAAKWDGSTDENNWAYAATKCAEAILDVNPHALIMIEGVEQSLSGAQAGDYWGMPDRKTNSPYIGAWWGGNFRGAREYPIKPKQGTSQIVYSPHDYGPSVYAQTWFDKNFTEQTLLDDYWYDTWAYINAEDIAPELIGEWGGHMEGDNLKWMTLLRDYMIKHHINHTFWCLNTNSGDTGGLWDSLGFTQGSGTTIAWNEPKYKLFEEALWQTQKSGKYIGLDHQVALGKNGISLNDFYANYAASEGSNLDGGKTSNGKTVNADPAKTTTTTTSAPKTTTTTSKTTSTSSSTSTTTTSAEIASNRLYGDANCDGQVDLSDAVLIMQSLANPNKYGTSGTDEHHLTSEGSANADVEGNGNGITTNDAQAIQMYLLGKYTSLPVK